MTTVTKTVKVDLIGFDVADRGFIEVRFALLLTIDDQLVRRDNHRQLFPPGSDIDEIMYGVNLDLQSRGYDPVGADGIDAIKAAAAVQWTQERIDAYNASVEAANAG